MVKQIITERKTKMKCKKCGAAFDEGIFCPECGTKVELELSKEEKEQFDKGVAERELLLAKQKAEQERIAKERDEAERLEREKQKQERIAKEKAEQERIAKEKAEQERIAKEKAERLEQERIAREKAERERERIAKEKDEQEKIARAIENEGKVMSVLSLICGIVALVTLGCWFIPEILGIVFACKGKKQGKMRGKAKGGLICSIISIVIVVLIFVWALSL